MKKLLIILCLDVLIFSCTSINKCNYNDNNMNESGKRYDLQVHNLSEIPKYLLENMNKMGLDSSSILNEYEGKYLNYIFKIDQKDFNLVGKKVGFSINKLDYFSWTRVNVTTVGGSSLYIFDTIQKVESGGYDAAIVYWSKFVIPLEKVVKNLNDKH